MRRSLSLVLAWLFLLTTTATAADPPIVLHNGNTVRLPSATALQVQAPTTANASINMPHGTAPSAPTNGDCWTTTTGLFCRINGVTKGPYADGIGTIGGGTGSTDNAIIRADGTGGATIQGGSSVTISDTGAFTFPDGVRQTFNPDGTNAGLNVGSQAGDPSAPSNGDLWYDSTANELTGRINGANVALGAGGGNNYYAGSVQYLGGCTGDGSTGTCTVSNIPTGFKHLILKVSGRGTNASSQSVNITVNGLSTSIYDLQRHYATSTAPASDATLAGTSISGVLYLPGTGATSGFVAGADFEFFNYSDTNLHKAYTALARHTDNGSTGSGYVVAASGQIRTTSAISSLTATLAAGNFASGSLIEVYGVGGSVTVNPQPGLPVISETVTSGSQSSVTVSSIPSTYRDLLVVVTGRCTVAATLCTVNTQFNGDTGSNYDRIDWEVGGTPAQATGVIRATTGITFGYLAAASATANVADTMQARIANYAGTTFQKTVSTLSGVKTSTGADSGLNTVFGSGWWRSTSAITSLTIAPTSGAFVDGTVVTVYGIGGSPTATLPVVPPQGRLTLTSNTPVMSADATAQGTIYYTPFVGTLLPVGNVMYRFSQLSYALNTTAHTSGNLYDIGAYNSSGTITLCTAPAWTNSTARSAAIAQDAVNGIWTNSASLTCNLSGGTTTTTIAAGQWTYLGTLYATANGQTGMAFKPAAASGGTNNILGLYNAYNRVRFDAICRDTTGGTDYSYNSTTWRAAKASNSNRISWVDGLQSSSVLAVNLAVGYTVSSAASIGAIGTSLDSTTAAPGVDASAGISVSLGAVLIVDSLTANENFAPQLGFHYLQRMEVAPVGTYNFGGSATSPTRQGNSLTIALEMSMLAPAYRRRRRKAANDNASAVSAAA